MDCIYEWCVAFPCSSVHELSSTTVLSERPDLMVRFGIVIVKCALLATFPKIADNFLQKGEVRAFQVMSLMAVSNIVYVGFCDTVVHRLSMRGHLFIAVLFPCLSGLHTSWKTISGTYSYVLVRVLIQIFFYG